LNGAVQNWKDDYLAWKPEDYGGIEHIIMPPSYIWTPDIELYNRQENDATFIFDEVSK